MFTTDPKLDLLRQQPLFHGLSRREARDVASMVDLVDIPAGRTVVRQGEFGREFCVLASGVANVVRDGRVIATLEGGDHFGEMSLFEGRRVASVVAMTDLQVLVAHRTSFVALLDRHPSIGAAVLRSATERRDALAAA